MGTTWIAFSFAFAGDHIAVAHSNSPYVSVYPWTGSFGTKVADPATLPAGNGWDVVFT